MSLISNATQDELDSPYYNQNQDICRKWEQFILEKGGKINGVFNAWSFMIKSKITGKKTWFIDVKKSTYSGGNLLLSLKYQNLQEILTFKARFNNIDCGNFCISRSFFRRKSQKHLFYRDVYNLLKKEIRDRSLYMTHFKNNELTIIIHHKNDGFDIANRILEFDYH